MHGADVGGVNGAFVEIDGEVEMLLGGVLVVAREGEVGGMGKAGGWGKLGEGGEGIRREGGGGGGGVGGTVG